MTRQVREGPQNLEEADDAEIVVRGPAKHIAGIGFESIRVLIGQKSGCVVTKRRNDAVNDPAMAVVLAQAHRSP